MIFILDKNQKRLFLLDLFPAGNPPPLSIESIINEWKKNSENSKKRAYPQYILADDTLWMDIEKDPQSNFTLSREEIDILSTCTKGTAFPLFINGRAGSGKSTML
jgi:hypothetical protein